MQQENRISRWGQLSLSLSGACFAALNIQTESKWSYIITVLLALGLLLAGCLRYGLGEKLFSGRSKPEWVLAVVLGLSHVYAAKSVFFSVTWRWVHTLCRVAHLPEPMVMRVLPWVMAGLALPMAVGYLLWFLGFLKKLAQHLWAGSDFTEHLFFIGAGLLFAMLIGMTYLCTQAFYGAHINGHWLNFDLIYSADSGYLVHQDVYRNIGAAANDLRQPLFGLFSMPFAEAAWLLSRLVFFLPNSYLVIWQTVQMLLFLVAAILLGRMMALKGAEKALFLTLLCLSYPVLIFSLTAEQYLLAVFYLILMLYCADSTVAGSLGYIAATGSLLTTGVWFPLLTWDRDFGKFVQKTLRLCGAFFAVTILSGRLTTFLDIPSYIGTYATYTGADVAPIQKLMQFVNFAGACILAPKSGPDFTTYRHVSWQMLPVTGWSPVGLVVIVLTVLGILVSRKERITRLSTAWLGFSFLLLGLVGWGTIDNGLMLYSLYFGWAFVAMVYGLVEHCLHRFRPVKLTVLGLMVLGVGVYNIGVLREVLVFATQFFPTLGG